MRCVVSVATGAHYRKGQERLTEWLAAHGENYRIWNDSSGLPAGSPTHDECNYAFKAYALAEALKEHHTLLWCDASIIPLRSLEPLWERIERDGYWIFKAGWNNYQWTADSAYADLFVPGFVGSGHGIEDSRSCNRGIPHVATTAFGFSMAHAKGRAIFDEFYRLATTTKAFHGPWRNSNCPNPVNPNEKRAAPCGPPDVFGHRHDQSCLSVIAWRLGCQLTSSPNILAYGKLGEPQDERTILLADGSYA